MAGTKTGGQAAAATNKARHGSDFYARIGAKGGKNGHTGGFAAGEEGRERARVYGAIGGKRSKRGKKVLAVETAEPVKVSPARKFLKSLTEAGYYKPIVSVIPPHKTFYVWIRNKK